jgi:hypothetical protein
MRPSAKWVLGIIVGSVIAAPFAEPINWWIGRYLDQNPNTLPDAVAQAWRVIQVATEFIPNGLFPGVALGATIAFLLLRGWRKERERDLTVPRSGIEPPTLTVSKAAGHPDASSAITLANLDRFITESFLPAQAILQEALSNLKIKDNTELSVTLMYILGRDRELLAPLISQARHGAPSKDKMVECLDISFDHYWLTATLARKGKGDFSQDEQTRYNTLINETRQLFIGVRRLVATTPGINGVGKMYRTDGKGLDSGVIVGDRHSPS